MRIFKSLSDGRLLDESGGSSAAAPLQGGTPAGQAASGEEARSSSDAGGNGSGQQQNAAAAAAQPYRPQGLPDHLYGDSDNKTIDNLANALKGYRERDGQVPDKVEAYQAFQDVDPIIKPHIDTLASDPLFARVADYAKENKIPLKTFQGLTTHLMTVGAEMGIFEPPIDTEVERAALTPERAKHLPADQQAKAREQRMNDNYAFIDLQVSNDANKPGLSKEAADFAKMMLGDRAVGHEFFEYMRNGMGNGQQIMQGGNGNGAGGDARQQLQARLAAPEMQKGHAQFNKAAYDQLMADYQRVLG